MANGFTLYIVKPVFSGRDDDLVELARSNLWTSRPDGERMTNFDVTIRASFKAALDAEIRRTKGTVSSVVTAALSQCLGLPVHTMFQVSISGALVPGVYDKEVSVKSILQHRSARGCDGDDR